MATQATERTGLVLGEDRIKEVGQAARAQPCRQHAIDRAPGPHVGERCTDRTSNVGGETRLLEFGGGELEDGNGPDELSPELPEDPLPISLLDTPLMPEELPLLVPDPLEVTPLDEPL